ncbi:cadmium resistance transporter [Streptomyces sp. NPDC001685]
MSVYAVVFLIPVSVRTAAGRYLASRPVIAKAFSRWDHILLPVVLIGIGLLILIEGGAFSLWDSLCESGGTSSGPPLGVDAGVRSGAAGG